jgi:cyclophilin family peptidyl-prolyl cis-trans isomerase
MKKVLLVGLLILVMAFPAAAADKKSANPTVVLDTSEGQIVVELYPDKAPLTVRNFLAYVDSQFYDGTIFHRVIPDFMIQGGGFTTTFKHKETREPIKNEAQNGLANERGTIAMARTQAPHSATAQFFINTKDNDFLNFRGQTAQGYGYAVFGRVVKGMDVVDSISFVKTTRIGSYSDVPEKQVVIRSIKRIQ